LLYLISSQPVTYDSLCHEVSPRIWLQLLPKISNADAEDSRVSNLQGPPDFTDQLVPLDDGSDLSRKAFNHAKFERSKVHAGFKITRL
jgi:hypothetical protein